MAVASYLEKSQRQVASEEQRKIVDSIRFIPRLDIKGPKVVKGIHLEGVRVVGDPEELATKYYEDGADELIYLDVVASLYGRNSLLEIIERASRHIFIPLTVGGGIRSLDDIKNLLNAGADKISINSWAVQNPDFINRAAEIFGSQCIVGSIEAKKVAGSWEALYEGGRERSGKDAVEWAKEMVERGAGELLVTSIDQEGTTRGFDIALTKKIAANVRVPVIACGGAGPLNDFEKIVCQGNADAVSAAHVLHYGKLSIEQIKKHLHEIVYAGHS